MATKKKKVLIFGAGPGGLSAGIHLLENGGRENFDVTIVNLDHMLGGKAKSWRGPDGCFYDHGIHFVFGFYSNLRELMAKAGIKENEVLIPNNGELYWYEMRDKTVHTIRTSSSKPVSVLKLALYNGLTWGEKIDLGMWGVRNSPELFFKSNISYLDDICFKAWVVEHGMNLDFAKTSTLFRFTQDALFNWPYEISAYVSITAMRQIFTFNKNPFLAFSFKNLEVFIVNDGWSSQLWDPIGEYYKKLGGKFEFNQKLVGLKHNGKKITGVEIGRSDAGREKSPVVPVIPGSVKNISDFDYVISAIPMNNFRELNPGDSGIWNKNYFSSMHKLTGVVPIGMFAFFKENIKYSYLGHVNGLEPPLFNAIDYKPFSLPYKDNKKFGTVLHMQGQESGFEQLSDKELIDQAIERLSNVSGFKGLKKATLLHSYLFRGNRNHTRYLLTDPGTYKFRPKVKSPFENLYLAGDWIQNSSVLPCMEGAIKTGREAADYILEDCGLNE